jgi:acyl carrier protein
VGLTRLGEYSSSMDTLIIIKELASNQFGREPETIDADQSIAELGIDSLGFLEFLFELEDRLAISIPQESVASVKTLRELAAVVDGVIAAAGSPPA